MHHPRCVLCKLGGGRYVKTQLSLYLIYWADDMFQPLGHPQVTKMYNEEKYIQYKNICCCANSELSTRSCCLAVIYIYVTNVLLVSI